VTLALTGAPSGASLTCTTNPVNAVSGVATFAGCRIDRAGTYTLTATSGTLTSATSGGFQVNAGTASKLVFTDGAGIATCSSGSVSVGNGGTYTAWVSRTDAFGNVVSLASSTAITVAKGAGGGNAPSPASLTILANSAISSLSTAMGLPTGNPADTTYTASGGGLTQASCVVRKN
jgi:hypothetical protein